MREVALHDRERLVEVGFDAPRQLGDERLGLVERTLEVATLLAQELDVLRQTGALGLGQRVHRADPVAAPLEALEAGAQRGRLVVALGRLEGGELEAGRDLLEASGHVDAALLEAGDGGLGRAATLAELVDLAAQGHLRLRQMTGGRPVADAALGLARLVAEARDERLDATLQRRQRRDHVGAGRGRGRDAGQAAFDLGEPGSRVLRAALGARALVGGALPRGAPFVELDAGARQRGQGLVMPGLGRGGGPLGERPPRRAPPRRPSRGPRPARRGRRGRSRDCSASAAASPSASVRRAPRSPAARCSAASAASRRCTCSKAAAAVSRAARAAERAASPVSASTRARSAAAAPGPRPPPAPPVVRRAPRCAPAARPRARPARRRPGRAARSRAGSRNPRA